MIRVLLIVSIGLLVLAVGSAAEPEYDGKPLSYWQSKLRDKDTTTRARASMALGRMKTSARAAVPALTEMLRDKEARVRMECRFLKRKSLSVKQLCILYAVS